MMALRLGKGQLRSADELREHYLIEKELAGRLRCASRQNRRHLYASLYDELFQRVPRHPMLSRKSSAAESNRAVVTQMRFLRRFLQRDVAFAEIGPGDCALAFAVAQQVKKVYGIDVSAEITKTCVCPRNFELVLSDGISLDLPPDSINVAYSYQLMEHLHPEDAYEQLQNIYKALVPGGIYICVTPNRLNGPHDISRCFDDVPTGFHLKEYTATELSELFKRAGFSRVCAYVAAKGVYVKCPVLPVRLWENLLGKLPHSWRKAKANNALFRVLLPIHLVGAK